ncbi:hypothetical protein PY257_09495 [Ramlibacter sp. H39-3-26]|uniref:hypothetical protein n=1 Tax=Curvibacter soli TaxID=3031331 RepID=UPI0023DC985E|nr:hypothetical protein [Ramlibacter sp. H39-3-26]MDF1485407.1 hypothetical protein [Ramlibacter sp. H39-3-26]
MLGFVLGPMVEENFRRALPPSCLRGRKRGRPRASVAEEVMVEGGRMPQERVNEAL